MLSNKNRGLKILKIKIKVRTTKIIKLNINQTNLLMN